MDTTTNSSQGDQILYFVTDFRICVRGNSHFGSSPERIIFSKLLFNRNQSSYIVQTQNIAKEFLPVNNDMTDL